MRANLYFLRERFGHFNRLCFNGLLPEVTLRISSSIRTLGSLRHPRFRNSLLDPSQIILSVSNRLDLEAAAVEDILIHEMIHLYLFWNGIADTSAHGEEFRRMMHQINVRHKRNITVRHYGNESEKATDRLIKRRIVIKSILTDGKKCVTVCQPAYARRIYDALRRHPAVKSLEVLESTDPVYAQYPASRTPKLYRDVN